MRPRKIVGEVSGRGMVCVLRPRSSDRAGRLSTGLWEVLESRQVRSCEAQGEMAGIG